MARVFAFSRARNAVSLRDLSPHSSTPQTLSEAALTRFDGKAVRARVAESLAVDSTTPKRAKTAPSAAKAPPATLAAAPEDLDGEEAAAPAAGAPGKAAAPFVEVPLYDCDTEEEEEEAEVPLPPPAVSEKHPSPRKGAPLCELALHAPGPARPMCCGV